MIFLVLFLISSLFGPDLFSLITDWLLESSKQRSLIPPLKRGFYSLHTNSESDTPNLCQIHILARIFIFPVLAL